jgi:hypothetical protein
MRDISESASYASISNTDIFLRDISTATSDTDVQGKRSGRRFAIAVVIDRNKDRKFAKRERRKRFAE